MAIPCQPHYQATLSSFPRLADSSRLEQSFPSIAPQRGPRIRRRRCNTHRALQSSILRPSSLAGANSGGTAKTWSAARIVYRHDELLPRFAAYYTYLRALPRRVRRALQRQWRMPLAGVALMLALGQSPALAATIPVGGPVLSSTPSQQPTPTALQAAARPAAEPIPSYCRLAARRR